MKCSLIYLASTVALITACASVSRVPEANINKTQTENSSAPVEYIGHAISVPVIVNGSIHAKFILDTGSDSLILDEHYMARLGIKANSSSIKRVEGKDETGHSYTRYFAQIAGAINPTGARDMKQENPNVMFQKIIYDGLVGHSFFRNFIVTYDLPRSEMILSKPEKSSLGKASKYDVVNLGSDFDLFWTAAKDKTFEEQVKIWDETVERPHQAFYDGMVWQKSENPKRLERKFRRLKEFFPKYRALYWKMMSEFNQFDSTLRKQIAKFTDFFPDAHFSLPIYAAPTTTFNGKGGEGGESGDPLGRTVLAFGIDMMVDRKDNPDVLFTNLV